jgi:nucleotidyltransferase substrate binding protein (TIGR01987 family)
LYTSDKASLSLKKFANALRRLEEAVAAPPSPLRPDAVLQRFEFTFELCWKALRIHLSEHEGIEVSSPKGTLKEGFRMGLIEPTEEQPFTQMLEDRNLLMKVGGKATLACPSDTAYGKTLIQNGS